MKNIFQNIVFLLLSMTVFGSKAQLSFGVRAGLNASNVSFKNLPNKSERIGFHAGVFATIPVMPDFMSAQPELSYSTQGTVFKPFSDKIMINLDYINLLVPVVFKLSSIDIQVGPFASFLISKPDYTVYNDTKIVVDAFKKIDAGLTAGLAYNINKLMFGVRYNQGFIDVSKDAVRPFLGAGKNAIGQVSAGYKF